MTIVVRMLASPHPEAELVMAIAPEMKQAVRTKGVPFPADKWAFMSVKAKSCLAKKPCAWSFTAFSAMRCIPFPKRCNGKCWPNDAMVGLVLWCQRMELPWIPTESNLVASHHWARA